MDCREKSLSKKKSCLKQAMPKKGSFHNTDAQIKQKENTTSFIGINTQKNN